MSKGKSKKENFTEVTNQDPSENNGEIKRRKQKEKEVEETLQFLNEINPKGK